MKNVILAVVAVLATNTYLVQCSEEITAVIDKLNEENFQLSLATLEVAKELVAAKKAGEKVTAQSTNRAIGFTAIYTKGGRIAHNARFPFNKIVSNAGKHYSSYYHHFKCPQSGYYWFHAAIKSGSSSAWSGADFTIMMDGKPLVGGVAINHDHNHASNGAFVYCPKGYRVWVQCTKYKPNGCDSIKSGYHDTTFSGYFVGY